MRNEAVADSATVNKSVKITKGISAILLTYQATNGVTMNQGVYLHSDVDTLQLADGSDVLFNLNGVECQAQNFLESGKMPEMTIDEGAAGTMREQFIMRFGRYIGDPLYWLDPTGFDDLMLNLAHSLTISATAGFATTTGRVTAQAIVFEDNPPTHEGFFMTKSKHSWATLATGDTRFDLPMDYPYRMCGLRAFITTVPFDTIVTNVKITADNDAFVPIDVLPLDIIGENAALLGDSDIKIKAFRTDADTMSDLLCYTKSAYANALNDLDLASIDAVNDDQLTLQLLTLAVTPTIAKSTTDTAMWVHAKGNCYHGAVGLYFGNKDDPMTWWDPRVGYTNLEAVISQGSAGADGKFWIQQIRK